MNSGRSLLWVLYLLQLSLVQHLRAQPNGGSLLLELLVLSGMYLAGRTTRSFMKHRAMVLANERSHAGPTIPPAADSLLERSWVARLGMNLLSLALSYQ